MISRRRFLSTTVAGVLAAPRAAGAQQTGKIWRIGLLDYASDPASGSRWKALRDRLRELGYVEGQNVVFESRWSDGQRGRLPGLATELVNAKVDIIVTAGSEAAAAIKQATSSIPVVLATGGDLVALGVVPSLARPGGNVTGLTDVYSDLGGKQLELLKEASSKISRVAVLWDPANPGNTTWLGGMKVAAGALSLTLQPVEVHYPNDLEPSFSAIKIERARALSVLSNAVTTTYRTRIVDFAVTHQLPTIFEYREPVVAGGLIAYGPSQADLHRRAAYYVDRILKGAKPADLPVEQPMRIELVINVKTAKELGLTLPSTLLFQADEVIR